uniref:Uncharacterized protein n=1 Tax=Arundo donax TaxID=35708 RepID=A0A0A9AUW7_ARUDO
MDFWLIHLPLFALDGPLVLVQVNCCFNIS